MDQPTDRELIERSQQGDREAFGILVSRYQDAVYSLALARVGDPEEAKDIAQETFVKAYAARDRFQTDRKWTPWLFTIAANLCKDWLKRRKFQALSLDRARPDPEQGPDWEITDDRHSPEDEYLSSERRQQVLEAVNSLPAHYQEAVIMRYTQDLSYQEIASALKVPLTTVVGRLAKGKQLLRRKLSEYFGGQEDETKL